MELVGHLSFTSSQSKGQRPQLHSVCERDCPNRSEGREGRVSQTTSGGKSRAVAGRAAFSWKEKPTSNQKFPVFFTLAVESLVVLLVPRSVAN